MCTGAPGVAIPTQLGGTVQTLVTPQTKLQEIERATPGLVAYAVKVVCHNFFFLFVTFSYGSGSADSYRYLCLTDPAPDPAPFVRDLQDTHKKDFFLKFFCLFC
jgi:hypothetical protein